MKSEIMFGRWARRRLAVVFAGLCSLVISAVAVPAAPAAADATRILYGWGYNASGQVGDGTVVSGTHPVPVAGSTSDITQVAGSFDGSVALRADGTVWTWGAPAILGDGSVNNRLIPGKVLGLPPIKHISVSSFGLHVLAVGVDGSLWAWGLNSSGELGDGTKTDRQTPVKAAISGTIVQAAAMAEASMALTSTGEVWAWGDNQSGQLGNADYTGPAGSATPVRVIVPDGIVQIEAGRRFGVALRSDGSVWTWGDNHFGELGDGSTVDKRLVGTRVVNATGITRIAARFLHVVALAEDGTMWAWGSNEWGQIGDGGPHEVPRRTPVHLGLQGITQIDATAAGSVAVDTGGHLLYWGLNGSGQSGTGRTDGFLDQPTPINRLSGVVHVNAGFSTLFAMADPIGVAWPITGYAGKCMDISGANPADGTQVQTWTCNGTNAQQWTISGSTIQALGKCLDVNGANPANGTKVQLWTCNGTTAQQWTINADGTIRALGKCLDVTGASSNDGTPLIIWDCHGGPGQHWNT
ncbi:ricin-type beta-trefoil lectin domain protein [Streptosporangiaceae bacterium NEAU-GS5]|nr:ricin-type beta-trefoil lectin domain protein [Streptosporangiaceae bacterium NEAU-GS5]